jgi:hypothetical protein
MASVWASQENLEDRRKPHSHQSRSRFSEGPSRFVHTAHIRLRALTSLHIRYLCCLNPQRTPVTQALDLPPLHVCSLPNTPLHFPRPLFPRLDLHKLLFLHLTGRLGGRERARRFRSVLRRTNGTIPSCFLCKQKFPASRLLGLPLAFRLTSCSDYSTLKMEAICSPKNSVHFQRTTQRFIHKIVLWNGLVQNWWIYWPFWVNEYSVKKANKFLTSWNYIENSKNTLQTNKHTYSVVWVRERTIPTERPPLVPIFADRRVSRGQRSGSLTAAFSIF